MNYDIHIYWRNSDEREEALALQKVLIENNVQTFPLVEKPIGPHPYPMFESHVNSQTLSVIESLLTSNRKSCSVLINKKTGNHVYDHTKGAHFLGEPLELNIVFLKNF